MLGFNDDITSHLSAQIFDFCDSQLFQETFNQTSEITSASNILENNNNIKLRDDKDENNTDLSIIFDPHEDFENDIVASIDFSPSTLQYPAIDHLLTTTNQDQFDFSSGAQVLHQPPNILYSRDSLALREASSVAPPPLQLGFFEEACLSSIPRYNLDLNPSSPSCSFFGNSGLPAYMVNMCTGLLPSESNFPYNIHIGPEFNKPIQTDNGGLLCPDSVEHIIHTEDLQALGGIQYHAQLMVPQSGPAKITGLEDSTLNKVRKLSVEQRKEKIHRYMKKRNERNFNKKIKYACRKTLADSRPRVRGRFAKNDEFCEPNKQASSINHDDEDGDEDDIGLQIGVKGEEQLVESSDIFAHISGGANSFKCNYTIQSWI